MLRGWSGFDLQAALRLRGPTEAQIFPVGAFRRYCRRPAPRSPLPAPGRPVPDPAWRSFNQLIVTHALADEISRNIRVAQQNL